MVLLSSGLVWALIIQLKEITLLISFYLLYCIVPSGLFLAWFPEERWTLDIAFHLFSNCWIPKTVLANFVRGLKVNFYVFPKWSSLGEKAVVDKVMDPNEDPGWRGDKADLVQVAQSRSCLLLSWCLYWQPGLCMGVEKEGIALWAGKKWRPARCPAKSRVAATTWGAS